MILVLCVRDNGNLRMILIGSVIDNIVNLRNLLLIVVSVD